MTRGYSTGNKPPNSYPQLFLPLMPPTTPHQRNLFTLLKFYESITILLREIRGALSQSHSRSQGKLIRRICIMLISLLATPLSFFFPAPGPPPGDRERRPPPFSSLGITLSPPRQPWGGLDTLFIRAKGDNRLKVFVGGCGGGVY